MEFKYVSLGDICEVKGGKRLPKGESLTEMKNNQPYLRIVDFENGGIDDTNLKFVPDLVFQKIKRYTINKGNIFLSIVGTIGICGVIPDHLDGASLTENAVKIYPKSDVLLNPLFLMYFLLSNEGQHQINIRTVGSTQPKLAITRIKDIPVPLLDIKIQNNVVGIIHSFTEKINLNRSMINNLEQLAQTLFKRWFVDFEFPNENGEPYKSSGGEMVESEFGIIPKGWSYKGFSEICSVKDGTHDSPKMVDKGYPLVTSRHLQGNRIDFITTKNISKIDFDKVNIRSQVERFDILISMIGTVGRIYLVQDENINFAIKNVGLFKTSEVKDKYEYLYCLLKSEKITNHITERLAGSTQQYISLTELRKLPVLLPGKYTLNEYKNIINPLFDLIYEKTKENDKLISIRDTLLPKLLSGEIVLPEIEVLT